MNIMKIEAILEARDNRSVFRQQRTANSKANKGIEEYRIDEESFTAITG